METPLNKQQTHIVTIEKIVPEGKSLARIDGKVVFIWGGLPGEKAEIEIYKNKKSYSEARLVKILEASKDRIKPKENHYLICSPWQVLPYNKQVEYKKALLQEAYREQANINIKIDKFYESKEKYGYRTKLEFSFTESDGKIALAFHKRGTNNEYEIIDGCELGSEKMNAAAHKITEILNNTPNIQAKGLKSLTIRESKTNNQIIAILLYKFREYEINFNLRDLGGLVDGLIIAYSTIKSPTAVITELKYQEGTTNLEEQVLNVKICYPYDGFFQNNLPVFEEALQEMRQVTNNVEKIIELYSGSGSIGLNLTDKAREVIGIEIVPSAIEIAKVNCEINHIKNYKGIELADHKIASEHLEGADILILDPPRSGLNPKVIRRIIDTKPEKIIYLSCNPITQARDYSLLKDLYKLDRICGFDFYPNTLHMESLIILSLNK